LNRCSRSIWKNESANRSTRPTTRVREPSGLVDLPGEDREVERDLLHTSLAQQLDGLSHQELGEAVGRLAVAAHQRERDGRPAIARGEVEEPTDSAVRVAADHDETVAVVFLAERVERHREAPFGAPRPPVSAHPVELRELRLVELGQIPKRGRVAARLESRDRLAHLPDRAALE
jgi:hypothetical protein